MRRLVPPLAAATATALSLAACGASLPEPELHDLPTVTAALEQTVLSDYHRHGTAYCPTDVPDIRGQVFSCVVTIPGSAPAIFRVTVETVQGYVSYVRTR